MTLRSKTTKKAHALGERLKAYWAHGSTSGASKTRRGKTKRARKSSVRTDWRGHSKAHAKAARKGWDRKKHRKIRSSSHRKTRAGKARRGARSPRRGR